MSPKHPGKTTNKKMRRTGFTETRASVTAEGEQNLIIQYYL